MTAQIDMGAVLGRVLHAEVNRRRLKGARQRKDIGVGTDKLPLCVLECLFKGCAGLQAHSAGDARLLRADNVNRGFL